MRACPLSLCPVCEGATLQNCTWKSAKSLLALGFWQLRNELDSLWQWFHWACWNNPLHPIDGWRVGTFSACCSPWDSHFPHLGPFRLPSTFNKSAAMPSTPILVYSCATSLRKIQLHRSVVRYRTVGVSQVKPSYCFRLHPKSMISEHSTISVPDSL